MAEIEVTTSAGGEEWQMTTGVYPGKAAFSWQVAALKTCRMDRSRLDALRDGLAARDKYVYVFSADSDSAYVPADRMVLARVSREHIVERDAYEFFTGIDGAKVLAGRRTLNCAAPSLSIVGAAFAPGSATMPA